MEELKKFVLLAEKRGGSDIHLVVGALPFVRAHGSLVPIGKSLLTEPQLQKIIKAILTQEQMKVLFEQGDVDTGVQVGKTNLRMNVHRQSAGLGLSIRLIPSIIPTAEQLGFTEIMDAVTHMTEGLVIVSGPAGAGKSTTIAALLEQINQTQAKHIITLEDPIEYRFTNAQSLIEQRQLGDNFPTFASGLKHVLRQDPDVIMVGEMRDHETISLALTAAETGHLVISTLHAPNAAEAVERIVNVFDGAQQQQILVQLSATLKMVIAQHLVPTVEGGRVAAREILTSTTAVMNAIRQNNLSTIRSAIGTGKRYGMMSMEQSLKQLQKEGLIE
jgi:twitching motility protein PilT